MYDRIVSRFSSIDFQRIDLKTEWNLEKLREEILRLSHEGISFGIAGSADVGKTSTVNSLFGLDLPVGHTERGTDVPYRILVNIDNVRDLNHQLVDNIPLSIFDLPGLWDSQHEQRLDLYQELLPTFDVILWVVRSDNRARETDRTGIAWLLNMFPDLRERIVIGVNRAEMVPIESGKLGWDSRLNNPSQDQREALNRMVVEIAESICKPCNLSDQRIVYYSAQKGWNLPVLFNYLTKACPEGKKWIFANLKPDFIGSFLAHVDPRNRNAAEKIYERLVISKVD